MDDVVKSAHAAPKVMMLVESDNGFGHFNIADQVAQNIVKHGNEAAIASGTFFHPGAVFDYGGAQQIHLPTLVWDSARKAHINPITRNPYSQEPQMQAMRMDAIKKACEEFKPDVIMFELYPFMNRFRDYDVKAIKEMYPDPATRPKMVCLSRDIIHSGNPKETVRILNEDFDHVVVRGDGKLNKLEDCQKPFADIAKPVEYLGNVVSTMPTRQPMEEKERPVLVFSGGGHREMDLEFFTAAIHARAQSKSLKGNPWMIVASNNCQEDEFQAYKKLAEEAAPDGGIQVVRPFANDEFRQMIANSAAAVVRGSYNTTFELAQSNVPFVVIPRCQLGGDDEQIMRAEVLEKAGLARHFHENRLTEANAPSELADALDQAIAVRPTVTVELDFNGAANIAKRLVEIGHEHQRDVARATLPGDDVTAATGSPAQERDAQRSVG